MIMDAKLQLIRMQFNLLHDCIRSIIYFRHIADQNPSETAWIYIKDVLSDHLVQSWCKVFGRYGENTHWKHITEAEEVKILIEPFSKEKILKAVRMSENEWHSYHQEMLVARDEFFAHFDISSMTLHYPNLEPALQSAIIYREWLIELLNLAITKGLNIINKAIPTETMLQHFKEEAELYL